MIRTFLIMIFLRLELLRSSLTKGLMFVRILWMPLMRRLRLLSSLFIYLFFMMSRFLRFLMRILLRLGLLRSGLISSLFLIGFMMMRFLMRILLMLGLLRSSLISGMFLIGFMMMRFLRFPNEDFVEARIVE